MPWHSSLYLALALTLEFKGRQDDMGMAQVVLCMAWLKALKPRQAGPKSPSPVSPSNGFGRPIAWLKDPASLGFQ